MTEASLHPPCTVVSELRITRRYRDDYFPGWARFCSGKRPIEPGSLDVIVPEDRLRWLELREHLSTVRHTVYGHYAMTTHPFRIDRRRIAVRVVFEDAAEAVFFKMLTSS